jgi:hypothetical protein
MIMLMRSMVSFLDLQSNVFFTPFCVSLPFFLEIRVSFLCILKIMMHEKTLHLVLLCS